MWLSFITSRRSITIRRVNSRFRCDMRLGPLKTQFCRIGIRMFHDPLAVKEFERLVEQYKFKAVVETGTYHAESAICFARYVPAVYTMELNPEHFKVAKTNIALAGYKNKINLFLYDSADWLRHFLAIVPSPACFYLDAHWNDYWPILDELKALKGRTKDVVIIHDFQVPGKDFQFDTYKGQALNYDYVKADLMNVNPDFRIKYNEEAEGNRVGILYALPNKVF